jgi:cytochrome b561
MRAVCDPDFGLELPQPVAKRAAGWQWTGDLHGLLSNYVMPALVGLHVVAALYHHYVRGDGVLKRMLPGQARTPTQGSSSVSQ